MVLTVNHSIEYRNAATARIQAETMKTDILYNVHLIIYKNDLIYALCGGAKIEYE